MMKEDLCITGISDASHNQEDNSITGEMILLSSKTTEAASPIYWKSGVIRKVCTLPKAAETRVLMRMIDDGTTLARQRSWHL